MPRLPRPKQLSITVPVPRTDQNQGHRHWRKAANDRKADVRESFQAAQIALAEHDNWEGLGLPWERVSVHVRWYHPTARHRDLWNMVGCLKGTMDGLVRAGILVDDQVIQPPSIEPLTDREEPRVELIVTKE